MPKKLSCTGKFFIMGLIAAGLITRKVDLEDGEDMDSAYREMCDKHIKHRPNMGGKIMRLIESLSGVERGAGMFLLPCGVDGDDNLYMVPPHVVVLQGIPSPEALQKFPNSGGFLKEMAKNHRESIPSKYKNMGSLPSGMKKALEEIIGFGDIGKEKFKENADKKDVPVEEIFDKKNLKKLKKSAIIDGGDGKLVAKAKIRLDGLNSFLQKAFKNIEK